jgi:hypothetical protein
MHSLPVYVPNPDAPRQAQLSTPRIDPKSAIVSQGCEQHGRLLIYYEDNRCNAASVRTFADRALIAAGRLSERYPTIAGALVPSEAPRSVGLFTPGHGGRRACDASLFALASWLDLFEGRRIDRNALACELRLSRQGPIRARRTHPTARRSRALTHAQGGAFLLSR